MVSVWRAQGAPGAGTGRHARCGGLRAGAALLAAAIALAVGTWSRGALAAQGEFTCPIRTRSRVRGEHESRPESHRVRLFVRSSARSV